MKSRESYVLVTSLLPYSYMIVLVPTIYNYARDIRRSQAGVYKNDLATLLYVYF